ncbi:hypothetical protein OfM1_14770 [Lactovum odontotermitis]
MSISEATFLEIATNEYKDSKYAVGGNLGNKNNPITVIAPTKTHAKEFESNGLQVSVVKVDGQTVVAFRGSQNMDTSMLNPDVSQRTDGERICSKILYL